MGALGCLNVGRQARMYIMHACMCARGTSVDREPGQVVEEAYEARAFACGYVCRHVCNACMHACEGVGA